MQTRTLPRSSLIAKKRMSGSHDKGDVISRGMVVSDGCNSDVLSSESETGHGYLRRRQSNSKSETSHLSKNMDKSRNQLLGSNHNRSMNSNAKIEVASDSEFRRPLSTCFLKRTTKNCTTIPKQRGATDASDTMSMSDSGLGQLSWRSERYQLDPKL